MSASTREQAIVALEAMMPSPARAVCQQLSDAGHRAVAVGGAVRDAVLGRTPGDWDVATSASPEQVQAAFAKTIPTGIQHGTVTVLLGRGENRLSIEVTTFRGDGAYTDGRRPDQVVFGVPLREDLARRDLVINAMAYDPVAGQLIDPFGGFEDIAARRIRAVGVASERFAEDGLRVMRAVRFAAVLEFTLDADTEGAINGALPILAKVSRERVRDELWRMLGARQPSIGLDIARRTGVIDAILPELARDRVDDTAWHTITARVDAAEERELRLAALFIDVAADLPPAKKPRHPLRRLKFSNQEISRVGRLLTAGLVPDATAGVIADVELRTMLGALGRVHAADLLDLWRADERARPLQSDRISAILLRVQRILARGDALGIGELAVSGSDLIERLQVAPGRVVGELLRELMARVLADPNLNSGNRLITLARELLDARQT